MGEFDRNPAPKETPKGLPVVEADTVASMWQNYTARERWGDHLEEVKQRLIAENPELVEFIESQVGKFPDELHLPLFEIAVGTIAILENQAEANKLATQFGPEDPTS